MSEYKTIPLRPRTKDLTGLKFHQLTVIGLDSYKSSSAGKNTSTYWLCLCDCGTYKVIAGSNISNSKHRGTKSCGCFRIKYQKEKKGYNALPNGESSFNGVLYTYKKRAREWGRDFSLSKDEFRELIVKNCNYCLQPPSTLASRSNRSTTFLYNGLDRIDTNKGYSLDNVVTCCFQCNMMKSDYTTEEFLNKVRLIYENMVK